MVKIPAALRYSVSDAMLDYADSDVAEMVADMYRRDADTLNQADAVDGFIEVNPFVSHTAHNAVVEKLALAEEAIEQARRDLANAQAQYARYEELLNKIR